MQGFQRPSAFTSDRVFPESDGCRPESPATAAGPGSRSINHIVRRCVVPLARVTSPRNTAIRQVEADNAVFIKQNPLLASANRGRDRREQEAAGTLG